MTLEANIVAFLAKFLSDRVQTFHDCSIHGQDCAVMLWVTGGMQSRVITHTFFASKKNPNVFLGRIQSSLNLVWFLLTDKVTHTHTHTLKKKKKVWLVFKGDDVCLFYASK